MELKDVSADRATIVMKLDEVLFLCGAINETLNAISDRDFKLRTGETPTRAKDMWRQLIEILDQMREFKIESE